MRIAILVSAALGATGVGAASPPAATSLAHVDGDPPAGDQDLTGMVWIPPGRFTMGWDGPEARPDERPAHAVRVDGFWIDRTEVTNAQFEAFVAATGYITTAERGVDWDELRRQLPPGTPKPPDDVLVPGSLVFSPPADAAEPGDVAAWWRWTPGACWRHPEGPGSTLAGREDHPVVHVSWSDARAYAAWAGKRLPTEAEWERAARFGHDGARYTWGDELRPGGRHMANIWQGAFPHRNTADDQFERTAPVGSFPPNAAGLFDMAGNVWEWTVDQFDPAAYGTRVRAIAPGECVDNPSGPPATVDPRNPFSTDSRVQKGGSFLCHASYCSSYRPSAKMAATPDTGMSHLGFRCVRDEAPGQLTDELRGLDGEWVYVEDRTQGRALERLGPPMSSKFSLRVEDDAVILVHGHGSGHRDVRVALDGSITEVAEPRKISRYRGAWKDGAFAYEVDFVREPGTAPEGLIRRAFRPTADGLLVSVATGSAATTESVGLYRHAEDIPMPAPVEATIGDVSWLAGAWVGTRGAEGATSIEERWGPPLGGAMLGVSRTVRGGSMRGFEFLRIVERDGGLVYIAQPGGRAPTEFVLSELTASRAVFDNPRHDYPKRIVYELSAEGVLSTSTGFIRGGSPQRFELRREGG